MVRGNFLKLFWVFIFGIAFGFLEAAVVIYLRRIFGVDANWQPAGEPEVLVVLPFIAFLKSSKEIFGDHPVLWVELGREASTIIMLATLGLAVGMNWRERLAFFLLPFAFWDISYYIFLRLLTGWPQSLLTLDVLFLLPVPWVAPVIVPVAASTIFILISLWLLFRDLNR